MPTDELGAVWFPLGGLAKDEVRARAAELGLPNAAKPESQEICFVPDGDYAGFVTAQALRRGRPLPAGGDIVDQAGAVLGSHDGVHRFTVGQHRGLGNLATRERMYVVGLEPSAGRVVVGPRSAAERSVATVRDARWFVPPPSGPQRLGVQVRHRGAAIAAEIEWLGEATGVTIRFEAPTITAPGQAAVFYDGDQVIGGGWIS
jgi:tRNA-specific 2-thiouridylase